jgi:hypothetical protein
MPLHTISIGVEDFVLISGDYGREEIGLDFNQIRQIKRRHGCLFGSSSPTLDSVARLARLCGVPRLDR